MNNYDHHSVESLVEIPHTNTNETAGANEQDHF